MHQAWIKRRRVWLGVRESESAGMGSLVMGHEAFLVEKSQVSMEGRS